MQEEVSKRCKVKRRRKTIEINFRERELESKAFGDPGIKRLKIISYRKGMREENSSLEVIRIKELAKAFVY